MSSVAPASSRGDDGPPGGAPTPSTPSSSPMGVGAAVLAVTAWGFGNTLIAAVPMSGIAVAFFRLGTAVLLYVPILHLRGGRLSRRSFRLGWLGGVAFGANITSFFIAIRLTTVANAVTISALQPLVIMGFAAVMFHERIRARHALSAVAATLGVALVTFGAAGSGDSSLAGDAMAVVALLTWAGYFIASKNARKGLDTFEYLTVMNIVAFAVVAPVAIVSGALFGDSGQLTLESFAMICLIVCVPGSGHILINWAHGHTTLMLTSLITLALPVLSTVSAAAFLDQSVTPLQVAGIVVVLVALAAVILGDTRNPVDTTEPIT